MQRRWRCAIGSTSRASRTTSSSTSIPNAAWSPGERWQQALKTAADRCEAVLVRGLAGLARLPLVPRRIPAGQEPAQVHLRPDHRAGADRATARRDDRRMAVVRAGRRGSLPHLRGRRRPAAPSRWRFAKPGSTLLRRGLQRAGLDARSFPWPPPDEPNRAPYRGLRALEAQDAAIFFGRDADDRARPRPHPRPDRERASRRSWWCSAPPARANPRSCAPGCGRGSPATMSIVPAAAADPAGVGGHQRQFRPRGRARGRLRAARRSSARSAASRASWREGAPASRAGSTSSRRWREAPAASACDEAQAHPTIVLSHRSGRGAVQPDGAAEAATFLELIAGDPDAGRATRRRAACSCSPPCARTATSSCRPSRVSPASSRTCSTCRRSRPPSSRA